MCRLHFCLAAVPTEQYNLSHCTFLIENVCNKPLLFRLHVIRIYDNPDENMENEKYCSS
jgi:hypothetical protein